MPSLVGSEMCIRDRCATNTHKRTHTCVESSLKSELPPPAASPSLGGEAMAASGEDLALFRSPVVVAAAADAAAAVYADAILCMA